MLIKSYILKAISESRDALVNPNRWWSEFDEKVNEFYFMFVSGHFIGNYAAQLERISRNTQVTGVAMNVLNLLLFANCYKSGELNHQMVKEKFVNNGEFIV